MVHMMYKVNKSIDAYGEVKRSVDIIMNDMALRRDIQKLTNDMDSKCI